MIPKYLAIFNNRKVKHIILTSGRAGTKSSYAAIRTDYQIGSDPYGSAVVLRKHHNKLRKTVYKEMIRGINRLGISKNKFTITKSPMEITYKKYGTTIYFSGSDGIDDTKGIIDEDKPIKLVVLDELTEFFDDGEGEDELSNIEATFVRGNDSDFQMIYLYNPPKNPNAPINQWCKKMEKRDDCIHIHTDYRDVPVSWLGHALIASAEAMKRADEKMYRWVWLGQATAKLLNALDMEVIAYDAHESEAGKKLAEYVSLDELFARSDVIFLHCPLFPATEGIINKENIAKMKDGVILINNSRGQLVVEQDLADALNSGKVYAAGLDVVSTEPIKGDNPLLTAKNCIITPHISWAAQASRQRIMDITVDNIKAFLEGNTVNQVNK